MKPPDIDDRELATATRKMSGSTAAALRDLTSFTIPNWISLALLAAFFPGQWTWVGIFSISVAIGGFFWALLYSRSRSLIGPWISHLLVDAGILAIGYDLAFRT